MKRTITIPMLVGPGGRYYACGFGDKNGYGEVDEGFMWDRTDVWGCRETDIQRVDVQVEVEFPDDAVPTLTGSLASVEGGPASKVEDNVDPADTLNLSTHRTPREAATFVAKAIRDDIPGMTTDLLLSDPFLAGSACMALVTASLKPDAAWTLTLSAYHAARRATRVASLPPPESEEDGT